MTKRAATRKRPCKICRKWFTPNPKCGSRYKTCDNKECKQEWHKRKCTEWNRKNPEYFKGNYLLKKIEAISTKKSATDSTIHANVNSDFRLNVKIDPNDLKRFLTVEQIVAIEYLILQSIRPVQDSIRSILFSDMN